MSAALILVVEDNAATRKMMRLTLQAEGYSVLEAEDGEGALLLATERSPALVLLDCKLPDMDGFEVGRRLHTIAPRLPVIAVTGWAQTDETRVLAAGFLDMLMKPVEPSRLVEIVERHLGHAAQPSTKSGKTVLLADDDPTHRKLAQLALSSAGFDVLVAEDGEAALRLATARKPDAIVSDVLMARMDGFAFCKAARAEPDLARVPIVLMSAHYLEDEDRALAARFGANGYVSRTGGFEAVVRAVLDAMEGLGAEPVVVASDDLQAAYLRRIAHQLERQATIGAGLARRVSLQASALSVLDGLSDTLTRQLDPESALGDTLAECLDAAGLSVGAILLLDDDGQLSAKAHVGSSVALDWGQHAELLLRAMRRGGVMVPSDEAGDGAGDLLSALGAASALVVPIVARDQALGALLLASNGTDLAGSEGESFVRAARSVSTQLGQALALSRAFSRLAASESRYRRMIETTNQGVWIIDAERKTTFVNARMADMLGCDVKEVVGRSPIEFLDEESRAQFVEHMRRRQQGAAQQSEFRFRRKDGTPIWTILESVPMLDDAGNYEGAFAMVMDNTERRRLEEQLRQSQKMDAVGRLAGGVAHDFNNVLSVILSYGEMLLADLKPGDPLRDDVEEIRKAGKRAADLTLQLLMFSRQQVIEPKVLDLNDVLASMDKMLQRILGADVDLVSLPSKPLGRVRADPGSVEQLVMNLVVNARDAMPTGGKLTMETADVVLDEEYARTHHGVNPGPHVMLAVTDTGVGMDKVTQARVFEPFFTTKEKGKGTGLGLSTVFGIVQQGGGSVWVYSEMGKGTTFKVYFPRVDAAVDPIRTALPPPRLRGSETILLVEDDDQVRAVALGILRRNGYVVVEARHAGEALLHAEKHAGVIHLLLTDVVMPQMSGPELAKRLSSVRPDMKVLCMSGYTDDSIVRHGVIESHLAYVQKPFTPATLAVKVREVLDAERAEGSQ
ncbi:MAG: response regulator [Polyangiaceae bacterium]